MKNCNLSENHFTFVFSFLLVATILMIPETVWANVGFGQIGENVKSNSLGIAQAIAYSGYAIGLGYGIWGCVDLAMAGNGRSSATSAGGLKKIFIGALLLGIGALLSAGSATLFGSDKTTGLKELGL